LRFGVSGLGFGLGVLKVGVCDLGFKVYGFKDLGFGVCGLELRIWGLGFEVCGLGFRISGFKI
jgi:hypothetical protein